MLPMADGTQLYTRYWADELWSTYPKPTVFIRSPYGAWGTENVAYFYLPYNFAVVMQNDRGTGDSQGNFTVNHNCATDGYDTMKWVTQQPWSNGQVYEVGISADGMYSYLSLKIPQPFLYGQFHVWSTSLMYFTAFQGGGAFRESLVNTWLGIMQAWRPDAPSYYQELIQHEGLTPWWDAIMLYNVSNVKFPGIHLAAWYDIFLGPQIKTFENYNSRQSGGSGKQKLVIAARGHCGFWHQLEYGWFPNEEFGLVWSYEESVRYFADNFSGDEQKRQLMEQNTAKLDLYTFYIMGASTFLDIYAGYGNYWTTLPAWPSTTRFRLYLAQNGVLQSSAPAIASVLSYSSDPSNPTPTIGGNNLFLQCGPLDQTPIETRADNLIFTTTPFTAPTAIFGNITVHLFVSSNCTDTDFVARVSDVYPDGTSILLGDELLRMRWRSSWTNRTHMTPGQVYEVEFNLWPTAFIFSPKHSLRLAITSSNYPRFSVNNNNGKLINQTAPALVARNSIFIGGSRASYLSIPTLPLSAIPENLTPV